MHYVLGVDNEVSCDRYYYIASIPSNAQNHKIYNLKLIFIITEKC